nr:callose synthase 3-like [Ipomoea batatas]
MSSRGGAEPSLQRRLTRTQTVGNIGESIFDSEVVPSSLVEIAPILRVANEVEPSNPRVAYLFVVSLPEQSSKRITTRICSAAPRFFTPQLVVRIVAY